MTCTIAQARKWLPPFAVGLGMYAKTVPDLRHLVESEIYLADIGQNPLEPKQLVALRKFLKRIEEEK